MRKSVGILCGVILIGAVVAGARANPAYLPLPHTVCPANFTRQGSICVQQNACPTCEAMLCCAYASTPSGVPACGAASRINATTCPAYPPKGFARPSPY